MKTSNFHIAQAGVILHRQCPHQTRREGFRHLERPHSPSRRSFLRQTGGLVTASTMIGVGAAHAETAAPETGDAEVTTLTDARYYLTDVRLEEGFEHQDGLVSGTRTGLATVEVRDGGIAAVLATDAALDAGVPRYSAGGRLMLPAFRDMHIHLDKTFYGLPWQAPLPRQGKTIMDMIAREEVLIPELLPTSQERAEGLIRLLLVAGQHRRAQPLQHRPGQRAREPRAPAGGAGRLRRQLRVRDRRLPAARPLTFQGGRADARGDGDGRAVRRRARPDQRRRGDGGVARRHVPDRARP